MRKKSGLNHSEWCALIAEQEAGEISITKFCIERNLAEHRFYRHRRRMRAGERIVGFSEVSFAQNKGIQLALASDGWQINIQSGFDADCLRDVVQALR